MKNIIYKDSKLISKTAFLLLCSFTLFKLIYNDHLLLLVGFGISMILIYLILFMSLSFNTYEISIVRDKRVLIKSNKFILKVSKECLTSNLTFKLCDCWNGYHLDGIVDKKLVLRVRPSRAFGSLYMNIEHNDLKRIRDELIELGIKFG